MVLLFVKVDDQKSNVQGNDPLIIDEEQSDEISYISNEIAEIDPDADKDIFDKMSVIQKRVIGTLSSFFAGIMYGFSYMPGLYIQDNVEGSSKNNNDYAFSMSTGIFLASTLYFAIYCIYKKNRPKVYSELIFPSMVTGNVNLFNLIVYNTKHSK